MPNFQNGKVYKIIDTKNEVIYIGSTTERLCTRYAKHKYKANGNRIILLELCPCTCREELIKKEQEYIEEHSDLLNKCRAYRSKEYLKDYNKKQYETNKDEVLEKRKEYRNKNKDTIKDYHKLYNINNKEKLKEKHKVWYENNKNKLSEKITCECGCKISKGNILTHRKGLKHINLMKL